MLSRLRTSPAMVVACVALVAALGGSAYAVTSFIGSDGKIHGCVGKQGQLALVRPGTHCVQGTAISWNQKGRKGDRGPRGLRGVAGANGTTIIARAHSIGSATATDNPTADPMTGNTWTQGANADNEVIGQLNLTVPLAGDCNNGGTAGRLRAEIDVNGTQADVVSAFALPPTGSNQTVIASSQPIWLLSPGGTGRTDQVIVKISDNCPGATHFTVNSVRFHVLAAR